MAIVTLRYWAAAREAAGLDEEKVSAATLADALAAGLAAARLRSPDQASRLELVLRRCSLLVDGEPAGTRPHDSVVLADSAVVEVLPPFAGG